MVFRHHRIKLSQQRACSCPVQFILLVAALIFAQGQDTARVGSISSLRQQFPADARVLHDDKIRSSQGIPTDPNHLNLKSHGDDENKIAVLDQDILSTTPFPFRFASSTSNICDEVFVEIGLVRVATSSNDLESFKTFFCVLAGNQFELGNLSSSFEDEWLAARKIGQTRLFINGGTFDGNILFLPESNINGYYHHWYSPASTSVIGTRTRSLAENHLDDKTVVVVRIKVTDGDTVYEPVNDSSEVSNAVFGVGAADVSLKSQIEACSYNKLRLNNSPEVSNDETAPGVIEIEVSSPAAMDHITIADAAKVEAVAMSIDLDNVDFVLYHFPTEVTYLGLTTWTGIADRPGKDSFYNDGEIMNVQTLIHELGHNLGLFHSQYGSDEYGDDTGYMGKTINGANNLKKCFNAAKSYELGWYASSPDRVYTFNPLFAEEFNGKLIGVADYGSSTAAHTLILEISENTQNPSYFLTFNKKKGINEDVPSSVDMVTIVQGNGGGPSTLIAKLTPGASHTFNDFRNGRDLTITTSAAEQSGGIDQVPITVKQETISCNEDSDCSANLDLCASATCIDQSYCYYSVEENCCGDGYCDASEQCTDCPADCSFPTDCNELDTHGDAGNSGVYGPDVFGIMFEVEALKDVAFYEIEGLLANQLSTTEVKIYTALGNPGNNLANDWHLVFDGPASVSNLPQITMTLSGPQWTPVGTKRKFYIAYPSGGVFAFRQSSSTTANEDVTISPAEVRKDIVLGEPGNVIESDKAYLGGLKYTYEELQPIDPGTVGAHHIAESGGDDLKDLGFNEDSTLILSLDDSGDVLAVSGVSGDEKDTIYEHYYKIVVFKLNPVEQEMRQIGEPITNEITSWFKDDARADVSLSGDGKRLAISVVHKARRFIFEDAAQGFVRIYTHSLQSYEENWSFFSEVYNGSAGGGGREIGLLVSLDQLGHKLVIGMKYDDDDAGSFLHNSGMVKVYDVSSSSSSPIGTGIEGEEKEYAGTSVMISRDGQCIIYGSKGTGSGLAYVYCLNSSGTDWELRDQLSGEADGDEYGYSVAITSDGDFVAVGAIGNDVQDTKKNAGHVRVYCYDGSEYEQVGDDIDGSRGEEDYDNYYVGDYSGFDIAMSDVNQDDIIRILIGSPNNQDGGYYHGEARLFEWRVNFSTSWGLVGDEIYGSKAWAGLGWSVVIDNTGNYMFVSHRGEGDDGSPGADRYDLGAITASPSSIPSSSPSSDPSAMPSSEPSSTPSALPSSTAAPSSPPSSIYDRDFQIRTTYERYDSYNATFDWCATVDDLEEGSLIKNRRCVYPERKTRQVFKRDIGGQIRLSRVEGEEQFCLKRSQVFKLEIALCQDVNNVDPNRIFTLSDNDHTLVTYINQNKYYVGYEIDRMFSRLRLYKDGSKNPVIKLWETKYGPTFD